MTTYYTLSIVGGEFRFTPTDLPPAQILTDVPWVGQNTILNTDDYSNSDCGPASLTMWLNYRHKSVTVDDVSRATGKPKGYTFTVFADLDRAANFYGLDLVHYLGTLTLDLIRREIDAKRPVLALVHYPSLPERYSLTYALSHWILIMGYDGDTFFYHDPYWPTAVDGAAIPITSEQLTAALKNVEKNKNTPMQGATEKV